MASSETWLKLKHFRPDSKIDKWGDPDAICDELLMALDDFRVYIGRAIYVTSGVANTGHSKKSYHYREQGACAVDVIIPDYTGGPVNLILDATRFGFRGIGWYPEWRWANKIVGGLHLDMRPLRWDQDQTINYMHSRWMRVDGNYIPMSHENIMKYGGNYGLS